MAIKTNIISFLFLFLFIILIFSVCDITDDQNDNRNSSNANLSALGLSAGTLVPAFNENTLQYDVKVTNTTSAMTITPESAGNNASITVNGYNVVSGNNSNSINLNLVDEAQTTTNTITINVTSEDKKVQKTYTVEVIRVGMPETSCDDAVDNDSDGFTDCNDYGCSFNASCM